MSPMAIRTCSAWRSTGERRHRVTWRGKLVLQVQDEQDTGVIRGPNRPEWTGKRRRWRDAQLGDLGKDLA